MIRVVLDTNIVVSALLQPLGPPAQVWFFALDGSIQMCISGDIYAEYEEVINRPRLQRPQKVIAATLEAVREKGFWVRPSRSIRACTDLDDDIFLECAEAARAYSALNSLLIWLARGMSRCPIRIPLSFPLTTFMGWPILGHLQHIRDTGWRPQVSIVEIIAVILIPVVMFTEGVHPRSLEAMVLSAGRVLCTWPSHLEDAFQRYHGAMLRRDMFIRTPV